MVDDRFSEIGMTTDRLRSISTSECPFGNEPKAFPPRQCFEHTLLDPKLTHSGLVKGLFPAFLIRPSVCYGPPLSAHLGQFKKGIGEN